MMAFSMGIVRTAAAVEGALDQAAKALADLDEAIRLVDRRSRDTVTRRTIQEMHKEVYALQDRLAVIVQDALHQTP